MLKKNSLLLFSCLLFGHFLMAQQPDSLLKVWQNTAEHDTIRLEAYKVYIWENYMFYQPDSALLLSKDFYQEAEKMKQPSFMAGALNHQAVANSITGNTTLAISKYQEAIQLYLEHGFDKKAAVVYSNIGAEYSSMGNKKAAAEYYFKALTIFEQINDTLHLPSVYNNLGVLYSEQKLFSLSLEYHEKSLNIKKALNDPQEIGVAYLNIGAVYGDMKDFENSEKYYQKAYDYIVKANDKRSLGNYYLNMGHINFINYQLKKSLGLYQQALEVFQEVDDLQNIVTTKVHLAGVYIRLKKNELAEQELLAAYEKAKKLQFFASYMEASKLLAELYRNKNDFKRAFFFREEYHLLKDSINNINQKEDILSLKFSQEYEKQAFADSVEFANAQQLNVLRISEQEAQIKKDRIQKYALFGGIGLMLVFGAFALRTYQRKKRDHALITLQHQNLKESHHEIQQSIHYSKRLQDVFLPSEKLLSKHFESYFILFKPKDVVSGDFYWFDFNEASETKIIAVADCTGHGVPGALVSIVCSNALNKVVKELGILEPAEILSKTREIVIKTFTKTGKDVRDGMDISVCAIKNNTIKFSGANNGMWLLKSNGEIKEFKANRQPVGWQEQILPFTQEKVTVIEGDSIYLLTDGYPDQFGGENGKKLKKNALKTYLASISQEEMGVQQALLEDKFEKWRGQNEQIDDVCMMGIRF
ncbi:MAG: DUF2225 domain-containing protein [Vicingaceae bacterium]